MMDEQIQALGLALKMVGLDLVEATETLRQLDEDMQILAEELAKALNVIFNGFAESLEELDKRGVFDQEQTTRKKKRARDRRMAVKMAHVARFSRYDNGRLRWAVKRRVRPRARERGPPELGQAAIHREKE